MPQLCLQEAEWYGLRKRRAESFRNHTPDAHTSTSGSIYRQACGPLYSTRSSVYILTRRVPRYLGVIYSLIIIYTHSLDASNLEASPPPHHPNEKKNKK